MQGKYIIPVLCCFLNACQTGQVEYKYPEKIKGRYEMPSSRTAVEKKETLFDKKYLTFSVGPGAKKKENTPPEAEKNKNQTQNVSPRLALETIDQPLWPAVLPVLSHYPIAQIQPDELVMTEWFSDPENPQRQLKINAVKVGTDIQITVLRRQKDKNGDWINQKNDAILADKIKNDIVKQSFNH